MTKKLSQNADTVYSYYLLSIGVTIKGTSFITRMQYIFHLQLQTYSFKNYLMYVFGV